MERTPSDVSMQDPEYWTFFASFQGSSFADRPCPASSRCWAARGVVRGRCLPPACPVGAAPRRPWIGGPESASAGDGGVLRPHHRPDGSQGQRSPPRAAASPSHAEGESTELEHQLRACSRLTARPQPQQPEPELQWVTTTKHREEGKLGRDQTPHPGRLGLVTPLLRSAAYRRPSWLGSCVRHTTQQGQRKLRVGLGAARTRPFPL